MNFFNRSNSLISFWYAVQVLCLAVLAFLSYVIRSWELQMSYIPKGLATLVYESNICMATNSEYAHGPLLATTSQ